MTHCTCDRDTGPRDEPCPLHPLSLEDRIKAHIAHARELIANAKTPSRRSK